MTTTEADAAKLVAEKLEAVKLETPSGYPSSYPPLEFDLIQELRAKTLKAIQKEGLEKYHPTDITKVKNDNVWLWRFLVHQRRDMNWAFDMLIACMKWRKEFGVNDMKPVEFPQLFDDIGAIYACNRDKQGNRIIIMTVRRYRKEPLVAKLIRRYFIYFLENLEKEDNLHRVTIIFDMGGAGLANVDMDFLYFMFECFKTYYPSAVSHILAFDMPWVFSAMWKVVKGWLNQRASDKVKFVSKKSMLEYIDADQLLVEFGGNATEETSDIFRNLDCAKYAEMPNGHVNCEESTPELAKKKQVHFAEHSNTNDKALIEGYLHLKQQQLVGRVEESIFVGKLLRISPAYELLFPHDNDHETSVLLTLISNCNSVIAYKVKTTSPTKFRVRPSVGIIRPGAAAEVLVNLLPGHPSSHLFHDKFLVIAMEIDDENISMADLSEQWRSCPREELMEHRIRCGPLPGQAASPSGHQDLNAVLGSATAGNKLDALIKHSARLRQEVQSLRHTLYVIVMFQVFFFIFLGVLLHYDMVPFISTKYVINSCMNPNGR